jgi:hypothetical protein
MTNEMPMDSHRENGNAHEDCGPLLIRGLPFARRLSIYTSPRLLFQAACGSTLCEHLFVERAHGAIGGELAEAARTRAVSYACAGTRSFVHGALMLKPNTGLVPFAFNTDKRDKRADALYARVSGFHGCMLGRMR